MKHAGMQRRRTRNRCPSLNMPLTGCSRRKPSARTASRTTAPSSGGSTLISIFAHSGQLGERRAGYEAIHMIRKGQACCSATGAKVGLLHRFIVSMFGIKVIHTIIAPCRIRFHSCNTSIKATTPAGRIIRKAELAGARANLPLRRIRMAIDEPPVILGNVGIVLDRILINDLSRQLARPCHHHRFPIRLVRRPLPSGTPPSLEQISQPETTLTNWR
jgi:hypothetical protein